MPSLKKAVIVTYAQPASDAAIENLKRHVEALLAESGFEPDEIDVYVRDVPFIG